MNKIKDQIINNKIDFDENYSSNKSLESDQFKNLTLKDPCNATARLKKKGLKKERVKKIIMRRRNTSWPKFTEVKKPGGDIDEIRKTKTRNSDKSPVKLHNINNSFMNYTEEIKESSLGSINERSEGDCNIISSNIRESKPSV